MDILLLVVAAPLMISAALLLTQSRRARARGRNLLEVERPPSAEHERRLTQLQAQFDSQQQRALTLMLLAFAAIALFARLQL